VIRSFVPPCSSGACCSSGQRLLRVRFRRIRFQQIRLAKVATANRRRTTSPLSWNAAERCSRAAFEADRGRANLGLILVQFGFREDLPRSKIILRTNETSAGGTEAP